MAHFAWHSLSLSLMISLYSSPAASRSLRHSLHCPGTPTHPLSLILCGALRAQVWNYFKYSPEQHLHLPHLPVPVPVSVSVYESISILFILSRPKKENRENEKSNLLREHIQRICCFAHTHTHTRKSSWFSFLIFVEKIQATCTKFSPGVVVVVFKSCAQREGAWKTKTISSIHIYLHRYNIHTYTYTYSK